MRYYFIIGVWAICALLSCRKDFETTEIKITNPTGVSYIKASIGGRIKNQVGNGIEGAVVRIGEYAVHTDKNGVFYFSNKNVNAEGVYIQVENPWFFRDIAFFFYQYVN